MNHSSRSFAWVLLAGFVTLCAAPSVAATISVTGVSDADAVDGVCSLREAILAANSDSSRNECAAGSGDDRIVFTFATPATIALADDLPLITHDVRIQGPGSGSLTVDGQDLHALFEFEPDVTVLWGALDGMTLTGGLRDLGGGVLVGTDWSVVLRDLVITENTATNSGGGIYASNAVGVHVEDCWISGNRAQGAGGGGGLSLANNLGVLVLRSTVSANETEHPNGTGGGIQNNRSEVTVDRSTISGNVTLGSGGGIRVSAGSGTDATLVLRSSTVYDNRADDDGNEGGDAGGGIRVEQSAGRIATLDMGNSLIAGNVDVNVATAPDVSVIPGVVVTLHGSNLVGTNAGSTAFFPAGLPNGSGEYVGSSGAPIDPRLGALDFFGGTTPSHRPLFSPDSLAIDHGHCAGEEGDQRGSGDAATGERAFDLASVPDGVGSDRCDIGAHERGADPGVESFLFADSFESENTLLWSSEVS